MSEQLTQCKLCDRTVEQIVLTGISPVCPYCGTLLQSGGNYHERR